MSDNGGPCASFQRLEGGRFRPAEQVGGAWSVTGQHVSPMNRLVVHELERLVAEEGDDGKVARLGVDVLGVLPMEPFEVRLDIVRPGWTIELLEATVVTAGRVAVRGRMGRLAHFDTHRIAGAAPPIVPSPGHLDR